MHYLLGTSEPRGVCSYPPMFASGSSSIHCYSWKLLSTISLTYFQWMEKPILLNQIIYTYFMIRVRHCIHESWHVFIRVILLDLLFCPVKFAVPCQLHRPMATTTRHMPCVQIPDGFRYAGEPGERIRWFWHRLMSYSSSTKYGISNNVTTSCMFCFA